LTATEAKQRPVKTNKGKFNLGGRHEAMQSTSIREGILKICHERAGNKDIH